MQIEEENIIIDTIDKLVDKFFVIVHWDSFCGNKENILMGVYNTKKVL